MIAVKKTDPRDPRCVALLQQSHSLMESLFPPEDNHYLSIDALCAPEIVFLAAHDGTEILGTGAIALKGSYAEVKSMFTSETARGRGIGALILAELETQARSANIPTLKLETGSLLHAAHRLYTHAGFTACDPFGDYEANSTSIFFEKTLT